MRPFNRVKIINGQEYLYEITPYYDPVTKKNKQHSRYLGKNIEGKPVKIRRAIPKNTYHYGELLPLMDTVQALKIGEILESLLPLDKARMLIALALNKVVRPMPAHQAGAWLETTYLKTLWNIEMPGPRISELLATVGDSAIPDKFCGQLIKQDTPASTLVYDLTSISSYSKTISLEHGYKREHTGTRQINLSLVMDKQKMVPLLYDVYPGSITDVSTLLNTIRRINAMGVRGYTLILDRGFFSAGNIDELIGHNVKFVIPATFQLKQVQQLVSTIHRTIKDPNNLRMTSKQNLFVKDVEVMVGGHLLKGYCYFSPEKEHDEQDNFYRRLNDVKQKLEKFHLKDWMDPVVVFEETSRGYAQYFKWRVSGDRFQVIVRKNAVARHVNRMGLYIIFNNDDLAWDDCLSTYKTRDLVEKGFDILKNDLETRPLNVQKEETLRGLLFVNFLALILEMRLLQQMRQTRLLEKYTIESLLFELEKLKIVELEDGTRNVMEMTRKQKDILEPLGLYA